MLLAATSASASLNVPEIVMTLLGGLALFLFGMTQMTNALKAATGEKLKDFLGKFTTNRFMGVFSGAFITTVVQSSSVTTVLLVGFVSAGLITLQQSVGVIMGANIGTTITAQIIAFKITHYALLMIAVGFAFSFLAKNSKIKAYGEMVMGAGVIFFGMGLMSEATHPLRDYPPVIQFMSQMENPWLGLLVSAAFTGIIQSSAATTGLLIVLAGQGMISLEAGIAMAFGANIGTCVTALLAAIGKPRAALRVSVIHILFNVIGVLIWICFIDYLADWIRVISPSYPDLSAAERLTVETPRQIANAHTFFNIANVFIFIWLVRPFAWLVEKMVPDKKTAEPERIKPKYLDQVYIQTPALALNQAHLELTHLGELVVDLIKRAPPITLCGTKEELDALATDMDTEWLYADIVDYLRQVGGANLTAQESKRMEFWLKFATYLEAAGDLVRHNVTANGYEMLEKDLRFSEETRRRIRPLYDVVLEAMELSLEALARQNVDIARKVVNMKPMIQKLSDEADEHLAQRLLADEPNRTILYSIESDTKTQIKRLYYYAKRIAKKVAAMENVQIEAHPYSHDEL